MSACAKPVYTTDAPREFRDFTEAIRAAESHDAALKLLSEKQAALDLLYPPRLPHARSKLVKKPDIYLTRNGQDWRKILQKKQRMDRVRRGDCVAVADIKVTL